MCSDMVNNEMEPQNNVSVSVSDTVTLNIKKKKMAIRLLYNYYRGACTIFIAKCIPYQPGVYNVSLFINNIKYYIFEHSDIYQYVSKWQPNYFHLK